MKTLSIIFIVIGLAAWMQQIAYADPSGNNAAVPKEQPTVARRFNAGLSPNQNQVPKGTAEKIPAPSLRALLPRQSGPGTTAIGGPATQLKSTVAITGQSAKATPGPAALNGNTVGRKH